MKSFNLLILLSLSSPVHAQTESVIESIDSNQPITITNLDTRESHSAVTDESLPTRFQIKTPTDSSVRIKMSDESEVTVGSESQLTFDHTDSKPLVNLEQGEVHANIAHADTTTLQAPHKFFLQTQKNATFGVRGTELHLSSSATQPTEMHTLSGVVDASDNVENLKKGKGQPIEANHSISHNGKSFDGVKKFDRAQFLQKLKQRQPRMHSLQAKRSRKFQHLKQQRMKRNRPARAHRPMEHQRRKRR